MKTIIDDVHKILLIATIPLGLFAGWLSWQNDHYTVMVLTGHAVMRAVIKLAKPTIKEDDEP